MYGCGCSWEYLEDRKMGKQGWGEKGEAEEDRQMRTEVRFT